MLGRRLLTTAVLAAFATSAVVSAAGGQTSDEHEQREAIRRQEAAAAADLDVLAARDAEIAAALDALAANLAAEREALATARREAARAWARSVRARATERATERDIADALLAVQTLAVATYVDSSSSPPLGFLLDSDDPLEVSHRATLADSATADLRAALERLERLRVQLTQARREAETAAEQAQALRDEVEGRVEALELAEAQQAALAAEVAQRIESRIAEAAALAALDSELSARITAEEVELGRRVANLAGVLGSGPALAAPPLRTVQGFTVHADIADAVEAMVLAAAADGIDLGGGGYRDASAQWALRVAHCPDPANSPASACSPPTAQVGASNHERGLAIDFTYQGHVISSHDSPAFRWLEANAERFGFHNLPSEPWHWSVDGN